MPAAGFTKRRWCVFPSPQLTLGRPSPQVRDKACHGFAELVERVNGAYRCKATASRAETEAALRMLAEALPEWCSVAPSAFSGELLFKVDRACDLHRVRRKVMALSATAASPAAALAGVKPCPAFA